MRKRFITLSILILSSVFLFGCEDPGPTSNALDDFTPRFGKGGGKGGGGGGKQAEPVSVVSPTSGGIVATDRNGGSEIPMARGDQDNSKTLDISDGGPGPTDGSNPLITLGFSYGAGFDRSQCVKVGNELPITKDEYIDVLTGSPPPSASFVDTEVAFPIKISKTRLGQEYNKQWIQVWRSDTSGLIWIARVIASGREGLTGNGDPLVTAQPVTPPAGDTRSWTKYTFEAGHGEIRVTTRFSSDFVECPYLPADEISVTVIEG